MRVALIIIFLLLPVIANADLVLIFVDESSLPYDLSPRNYDNSPRNYDNSVRNYDNSIRNYSNSPRNYDNSHRNYDNGKSGKRRLLIEKNDGLYFAGYYVWSDGGIQNFFSTNGERIFYSPPKTGAIFDSENGEFCGTLANLKGEDVLAITEKGQLVLLKNGVSLSSKKTEVKQDSKSSGSNQYSGVSSGHWVQENVDSGTMMILEDGSIWQIDPIDKIDAMLWLPISNITIVISDKGSPGYDYLLINTDDGEKAHAKYLGSK